VSERSQPVFPAAELFGCFWMGTLTATGFAYATFGQRALSPRHAAFECFLLGALTAAMLSLVIKGRGGTAALLIPASALLRLAFGPDNGWRTAISALLIAAGVLLVALVFDRLGRMGVRFGKFLVAGPLLGGVCLAVAPLSQFDSLSVYDSFDPLMIQLLAGIVVGDGAGLGVELATLWHGGRGRRAVRSPPAAVEGEVARGRSVEGGR
jgi:hypothetical protein